MCESMIIGWIMLELAGLARPCLSMLRQTKTSFLLFSSVHQYRYKSCITNLQSRREEEKKRRTMLGYSSSFQQITAGGANPQGLIEDVSTRGLQTVRIGELAGKLATGVRNVFTGYGAAALGQSINNTVLIGFEAGREASILTSATFVGAYAGARADRSHETTLVGYGSGELMKDCTQCVGVGAYTLREATAVQTTAVGCRALERSLDADYNVGIGAECMQNLRSGSFNTAVGFQAMRAAFTSSECVMLGAYAGYSNAYGTGITAVGFRACEFLEDGKYSVAVGAYALQQSSYTSNTVAIGPYAGAAAIATGAVLIGTNVASQATDVSGSVIIGESAASHHQGNDSVIIGARSAPTVRGNDSVIIGADALSALSTVFADSTVAIGRNIAPSLRNSTASVFIGPGADSFRASVTNGIAIGTVSTTTSDRSISIGGNIENERIASVLLGNDLASDADNSILVGKDITVASIIFFKDPLLSPYVDAVQADARTKLGASNIDYTDILASPDGQQTYLLGASAGYLTTPIANSSTIPIDLLPANAPSTPDLRLAAPDPAYALVQGGVFLTAPFPSPAAVWATADFTLNTTPTNSLSTTPPATTSDSYQETHPFLVSLPQATTVNITNFAQTSVTVPYYTPKRAVVPVAEQPAFINMPSLSAASPLQIAPPYNFPTPQTMPYNPQCNVVFELASSGTSGTLTGLNTRSLTYTLPIEAVFATGDSFAVRPVLVMRETVTQLDYGLNTAQSSAFQINVTEPRLFLPNALPAAAQISISPQLITYAPIPNPLPNPETVCLRLVEIPETAEWIVGSALYSSNEVVNMQVADAYPESANATYLSNARTDLQNAIAGLETAALALRTDLTTLFAYATGDAVATAATILATDESLLDWATAAEDSLTIWNAILASIPEQPDEPTQELIASLSASLFTSLFAPFGIYYVALNTRDALTAALATPPEELASTTADFFESAPPGAPASAPKSAVTAYVLWRSVYTIPRASPSIGSTTIIQATSPNTSPIIQDTVIRIKLPPSLTSSATTLTSPIYDIPINAAPPTVHPNWDIAPDIALQVGFNATPLSHLAIADSQILVPPRYGSIDISSPAYSLSNYTYTPSHPFLSDDVTLLAKNNNNGISTASQILNVSLGRIPAIYTRDIHAPWRPSTETSEWTGFGITTVQETKTSLSNLHVYSKTTDHEIGPDPGKYYLMSLSNYVPLSYDHAIGISTYTSNVTDTNVIASQELIEDPVSLSNILDITYQFTLSNFVYDFDNNLITTDTVTQSDAFVEYFLSEELPVEPLRYFINSNVLITIDEHRRPSYDTYTDHRTGETVSHNVRHWTDGALAVDTTALYDFVTNITYTPRRTLTYTLPTPNGSTFMTTIERNLQATSNVQQAISTANVRPMFLATNSGAATFTCTPLDSTAPRFIKYQTGPVSVFTESDVASSLIYAPVTETIYEYSISATSLPSKSITVHGWPASPDAPVLMTEPFNIQITSDYKAPLEAILQNASAPIYILQADGGFVSGGSAGGSPNNINFIPNSPSSAPRTIKFFSASSPSSPVYTASFTVSPQPHPAGQAINTGLSFTDTSILAARTFALPAAVDSQPPLFEGFSSAFVGWSLSNIVSQTRAIPETTLLKAADIEAGKWKIVYPVEAQEQAQAQAQVQPQILAQLLYSINNEQYTFPITLFLKDDFPLTATAVSSSWRWQGGSVPSGPSHTLTGQWWTDLVRTRAPASDFTVELMAPLVHAFLYDAREPDRQQWRFSLAHIYNDDLHVIPRVPIDYKNETLQLRLVYQDRPSPVYALALRPTWTPSPPPPPTSYIATISPSVAPNATLDITIDQADQHIFTAQELLPFITYSPGGPPLIFYVSRAPAHGIMPAKFTLLSNPTYQHNGSTTGLQDSIYIHVASGPFDVSSSYITVIIRMRPLPSVTKMQRAAIFASSLADLATPRTFGDALSVTAPISSTYPSYIHVIDSQYIQPQTSSFPVTNSSPIIFTINPSITATPSYPTMSITFAANASPTSRVNPLAVYPAYAHLFQYTMSASLNEHIAVEAFQDREQPASSQGFTYDIDLTASGANNFKNRSIGIYLEYRPVHPLVYEDAVANAQIARYQTFQYSLGAWEKGIAQVPLFNIDVTKESNNTVRVDFASSSGTYTLSNLVVPGLTSDTGTSAYSTIYLVNSEPDSTGQRYTALFLGYDNDDARANNVPRNILANLRVPPMSFNDLSKLRFEYNLEATENITRDAHESFPVGELEELRASYTLSNHATTLMLRNLELLINTNTIEAEGGEGGEAAYDKERYNVVIGNTLQVRGVDNICIGSKFTTSGQNSIILGNNIGIIPGSAQVNEIYESIVIGSDSFANAFVRDVISIGKNNYNDLIDIDAEQVAAFLSRKPILVGNDITKNMVDYHVNVGNTFLRTSRFGEQIYLGVAGEYVGVGFTSNMALQTLNAQAKLHVNGRVASTGVSLSGPITYNSYVTSAPQPQPQPGDIVRYAGANTVSSTVAAEDSLALGVWTQISADATSELVTSGRALIYVMGMVNSGELLTSAGPAHATPGTAIAQSGPMAQVRMSFTVAKALETVDAGTGDRVLIECWVLCG